MSSRPQPTAVYEEIAPDPGLQHWVAYGWRFLAVEAGRHPIPPETGFTVSALPEIGHVSIRGPHDHAIDVEAPRGLRVIGIRLWPGTVAGLNSLAPIQPSDWVNREEPADAWVPELSAAMRQVSAAQRLESGALDSDVPESDATVSREQLARELDQALSEVAFDPTRLDHDVVAAVFRLLRRDDPPAVAELARDSGLSPRQFRRRFRQAVGLSPRAFRRARRIRVALEQAVLPSSAAWIDLAGSHGYADQAHLCREFRRTTGRSPRSYVESVRHIEHHLSDGRNVQDTGPGGSLD